MKLTITGFKGSTVKLIDEAGNHDERDIFEICDLKEADEVVITIANAIVPARINRFDKEFAVLEYTEANGEVKFLSKLIHDIAGLHIGGQIQMKILQIFEA
ncbi:MAG: hypothetical protein WCV63_09740 [Negativicutes bacterium]|jgi:hypothetical protein